MNAQTNLLIKKRLRPLYVVAFFQGFVFWYAVEKLFMKTIGFNDESIAVATVLYIVVMMLANMPCGILADRWSRKGVLCIASISLLVASVICGTSHSFLPYVVGISIWGLFYACYAGTYDSIIYDVVLEATGKHNGFERFYGKVQFWDSAALILTALLCGTIATRYGLRADFLLTAPFTACSIFALLLFHEPQLHKKDSAASVRRHLDEIRSALGQHASIIWLVISIICNVVAMRILFEFLQLWFIGLGLPVSLFGPATILLYVGLGCAGSIASRAQSRQWGLLIVGIITLLAACGFLFKITFVVLVAVLVVIAGVMALNIMLSRLLHDSVASNIRAGTSSMASTAGYGVFIPVALGFGVISQAHGIFRAGWFEVGSLVAMILAFLVYYWFRSQEAALKSIVEST